MDALRLLVGRGGDPERCDNFGNTALHLASARGHMNCVTFLVNFGVNMHSLDIGELKNADMSWKCLATTYRTFPAQKSF